MVQRVRALEAFLADVYGDRQVLADGVVPHSLLVTSSNFARAAAGIRPPNGVRVHLAGIDLVRGSDGRAAGAGGQPAGAVRDLVRGGEPARRWPGSSPGCSWSSRCSRWPPTSATTARRAAGRPRRAASSDPTVVLLTPGVHNSAYFEHAFLARKMGIELVEGRDLVCRDNVLYMRTTSGQRRVDVVYRRIDDDFLDPVQFRPDSVVGCPGCSTRPGPATSRSPTRSATASPTTS